LKYKVIYKPVFCIQVDDFFSPKINKDILNEAIKLKAVYRHAIVGKGKDPKMRNNKVVYYDDIFTQRDTCVLIKEIRMKFEDVKLREILSSCPYPISDFPLTTTHETQVSRYGDNKQKYNWHIDRFSNLTRHITMVYWFCNDNIKIKGGEIGLTNSPIHDGNMIDTNAEILKIPYKNNRALFFSSNAAHCVFPTTTNKKFSEGRFSANIWIGFK